MKQIKLVGFTITKINAEKNPGFNGDIKIKPDIKVISIEKYKLELIKTDGLKINFLFSVDYGQLGKLIIEGYLILLPEAKELKEILNKWKDEKIEDNVQVLILNLILQRCSLKALQIEEDMTLPLHIQMPRFQSSNENKKN
ncbi:MAG: hypothetical protein ACOYT4_01685 [Nanoarchaeota archaeon]